MAPGGIVTASPPDAYAVFRAALAARAGYRCEVPWCRTARPPFDAHHIPKRNHSGRTHPHKLSEAVYLCRACHAATDLPSGKGTRLVIEADGDGWRFSHG